MSVDGDLDTDTTARKKARHTRSTTGCFTCREHKKVSCDTLSPITVPASIDLYEKCDEQKPVCKRCRTNDRQCHWHANDGHASPRRPGDGNSRTVEHNRRQSQLGASADLDASSPRRSITTEADPRPAADDSADSTLLRLEPENATSGDPSVHADASTLASAMGSTNARIEPFAIDMDIPPLSSPSPDSQDANERE